MYLRVPGISYTAILQSHPFTVSWCDDNRIWLVAQAYLGFTERLLKALVLSSTREWKGLIEGPYSRESDLRSYGTVLLAATGLGIAE